MKEIINILRALSDETRLRILKLLEHGELCVCDIVAALGMIQPNVSFHLGILKEAGLIKDRKHGRWIHYSINDSNLFKRFLILSILENISEDDMNEYKRRLHEFLQMKQSKPNIITLIKKHTAAVDNKYPK